jgi:lauroyl/myristoyl acyltransferase
MRRVLRTIGLVWMYGPYLRLLRLVGPRPAIVLSRGAAWLHGLMTYLGAEAQTLDVFRQLLPRVKPGLRPRRVLRQYITLKHQLFAEKGCAPTKRGDRFLKDAYPVIEGREHLDAAMAEGRGVIVLVFHWGMARTLFPALHAHGYPAAPHMYRGERHAAETYRWVARFVRRATVMADKHMGPNVYQRPGFTFPLLVRALRRGALLGMNADGMISTDFREVPFLGGTIRLPTGTARLAAHSKAPILPTYAIQDGLFGHRIVIHPPIRSSEDTPEATEKTMRAYVALLEDYLRRYPWQWWTWRRLRISHYDDGRPRINVWEMSMAPGSYL